uniref:Uncharacterized protein n=1 Tax=Anguilla anguilla TaxID=7936 RepID=A0A0E9TK77_ANGAN
MDGYQEVSQTLPLHLKSCFFFQKIPQQLVKLQDRLFVN